MPNNNHRSAAVPFYNQKGERSMKRVKVERYVAGKKPSYANDEEEEYYTTDDEVEDENEDISDHDEEQDDNSSSAEDKKMGIKSEGPGTSNQRHSTIKSEVKREPTPLLDDDEEDDDPRFRKLKQIESDASRLLAAQTNSHPVANSESRVVDHDEEEEEEEIRLRHAAARSRTLGAPIGLKDILAPQDLAQEAEDEDVTKTKRLQTDDFLKDFKITGLKSESLDLEDEKKEEKLRDMLEEAKQEAVLTAQLRQRIAEENKRELAKEALSKGDIGVNDMESVRTDDEDDETAYEAWKQREIKRVLRDCSVRR